MLQSLFFLKSTKVYKEKIKENDKVTKAVGLELLYTA